MGSGFCQQKAVLLASLLRSRGIPAGIVLQDLLDHKIPPHYVEFLGSQRLERETAFTNNFPYLAPAN